MPTGHPYSLVPGGGAWTDNYAFGGKTVKLFWTGKVYAPIWIPECIHYAKQV